MTETKPKTTPRTVEVDTSPRAVGARLREVKQRYELARYLGRFKVVTT